MDGLTAFVGSLAALVVSLTGAAAIALQWRKALKSADEETDRRVDQMWEAHMLRARLSTLKRPDLVVNRGRPTDETPVLLREEVKAAYAPIAPALRALRRDMADASAAKFAEAVHFHYGAWLVKHICAVLGVTDLECLVMAQSVAEEPA